MGGDLQMYFCVRSRQKSCVGIIQVNFREQRSRCSANCLGRAHQLSGESLLGELCQSNVRGGAPRLYVLGVFFGNVDKDAESARL
jgi:hypothetical protein